MQKINVADPQQEKNIFLSKEDILNYAKGRESDTYHNIYGKSIIVYLNNGYITAVKHNTDLIFQCYAGEFKRVF